MKNFENYCCTKKKKKKQKAIRQSWEREAESGEKRELESQRTETRDPDRRMEKSERRFAAHWNGSFIWLFRETRFAAFFILCLLGCLGFESDTRRRLASGCPQSKLPGCRRNRSRRSSRAPPGGRSAHWLSPKGSWSWNHGSGYWRSGWSASQDGFTWMEPNVISRPQVSKPW